MLKYKINEKKNVVTLKYGHISQTHTDDGDELFAFDSALYEEPLRAAASSSRWRRNLINGILFAAVCRIIDVKTIFPSVCFDFSVQ